MSPSLLVSNAAVIVLNGCSTVPSPFVETRLSTTRTRCCAKAAIGKRKVNRQAATMRFMLAGETDERRNVVPRNGLCYKGNHGFHTGQHSPRSVYSRRRPGPRQQDFHRQRRRQRASIEALRSVADRVARAAQIAASEAFPLLHLLPRTSRTDPAARDLHAGQ